MVKAADLSSVESAASTAPTAMEWDLIAAVFAREESSHSDLPESPAHLVATRSLPARPAMGLDSQRFHGAKASRPDTLPAFEKTSASSFRGAVSMVDLPVSRLIDSSEGCSSTRRHSSASQPIDQCAEPFEARYSMLEQGRSRAGIVQKAEHKKTGQVVAVKKARKSRCGDASWSALRTGALVHRELDHPNIVRLEDVYETDTSLVQVMEYLSGDDLADALQKRRKFSEDEATTVLRQLLQAVDYLHDRSVVHRDIKLDNIMFTSPDGDAVKLIDFGMATSWNGITRLTLKCGTTDYAAPEQLQGSYTEKADMWSIGVVTYMLLTGEPLYKGTEWEIHAKARAGQPDIMAELSGFSPNAQDFIFSLLASRPTHRMSADEALSHPWLHV